jgi:hypothetical protein
VISATENSNKFQKTRFWKEKSVEDVVALGPTAQATLVHMKSAISLHTIVHQVGKTIELYKKFCGKWFKICL